MMSTMMRTRILFLQILTIFVMRQKFTNNNSSHNTVVVDAVIPCSDDSYCEKMYRPGSYCIIEQQDENDGTSSSTGVCSNPFAEGCLKALLPEKLNSSDDDIINQLRSRIEDFHTILEGRICNSDDVKIIDDHNDDDDDDSSSGDRTQCKAPLFEYPEIRIHNSNWESSIFISWIFQILLMEILEVPVAIGLGQSGVGHNSSIEDNTYDASFYNPYNTLPYSSEAYPWHALEVANEVGDCNEVKTYKNFTTKTLDKCAHVLPEVSNGQMKEWRQASRQGYITPVESIGEVVKFSWYVPKYTVSNYDNSLISFYAARGEENRQRLAAAFKRPLQWKIYCEKISLSNCTEPDTVATHYPVSESEQTSYFSSSHYTGYFHLSDKNNCTKNPTTCTGLIVAPPCTWSTNIDSQLYWNNIVGLEPDGPLEPNDGYSYSAMTQIWRAANATKSNVIMWWWKPDVLVEEFFNTSYEFQPFLLPEATHECAKARVDSEARCSKDIEVRRGLREGACEQEPHAQYKAYAKSLRDLTLQETNLAYRSPGYTTIKNIRISDLEMANIMRRWINVGVDKYGYDPRMAVCSWVVDNIDSLLYVIPDGYPRKLDTDQTSYHDGYKYAAAGVGCFTNLLVWITLVGTYVYRNTRIMRFAQVSFIQTILFGYALIAIASIVVLLQPPTDLTCTITAWLVTLGYSIELVPLLVKVAAINKINQMVKKMKRVNISQMEMAQRVIGVVVVVVIFLIIWTVIDPLSSIEIRTLEATTIDSSSSSNDDGNESNFKIDTSNIILSNVKCNCTYYSLWNFIVIGFQGILLIMASVLAFQSRNVQQEFNESRSLGIMIYSHFIFLLLRMVVIVIDETYNNRSSSNGGRILSATIVSTILSFLYSFDTIAALCIYILPKVRKAAITTERDQERAYRSSLFKRVFAMSLNGAGGIKPPITVSDSFHDKSDKFAPSVKKNSQSREFQQSECSSFD